MYSSQLLIGALTCAFPSIDQVDSGHYSNQRWGYEEDPVLEGDENARVIRFSRNIEDLALAASLPIRVQPSAFLLYVSNREGSS